MKNNGFALLLIVFLSFSFFISKADTNGDNPVISIHDTIVAPGELLLQVDALNFTGDNGQVSAITLNIDIDTCLIKFLNIENVQISGGQWIANYNPYMNYLSIMFTHYGTGHDINGKLLDIHIEYNGGFDASLDFNASSEIVNVALQPIQDVVYENGLIQQIAPVGSVEITSLDLLPVMEFEVPVIAGGEGFVSVNKLKLKINYNHDNYELTAVTSSLMENINVKDTNGFVLISWQDVNAPLNLVSPDSILFLKFNVLNNESGQLEIKPCSKVYNNDQLVATEFINGLVNFNLFPVILYNNPIEGGTTEGEGIYEVGQQVTIQANPNTGYDFTGWTKNDTVISSNTSFTFIKEAQCDTFIANYQHISYLLTLNPIPDEGGTVVGSGNYFYNDTVLLEAIPADGFDFNCWVQGEDTLSENPEFYFIMPSEDVAINALFSKKIFNINAEPNNLNYGNVTGGGSYFYGDTAILVATPNQYYQFVLWSENGQAVSNDSIYSFVVEADRDLVAIFQLNVDCPAPVALWVDDISYDQAKLHWEPAGSEQMWDVLWGEEGFDTLTEGNLVEDINMNEYLLTGLNHSTSYEFYVKAKCEGGFESSWSNPFSFTTWYVDIEELGFGGLQVYPNPAKEYLYIRLNQSSVNRSLPISLVDIRGREVFKAVLSNINNKISLSLIKEGIYFLKVGSGAEQISKKILIIK